MRALQRPPSPILYFSVVHSYFLLTVQIILQRNSFIGRLSLRFWMDIHPKYWHPVTSFVNLLNTIIQLPIFFMRYDRMVDSWNYLGIQGTSLFLILVLNLIGIGKMDRNLNGMWIVLEKHPNKPEIQRIQKICPSSNTQRIFQIITFVASAVRLYTYCSIFHNLRGETTRTTREW